MLGAGDDTSDSFSVYIGDEDGDNVGVRVSIWILASSSSAFTTPPIEFSTLEVVLVV